MEHGKTEVVQRHQTLKTDAIILARGGSKGIKHKNIKKLYGQPLIYYSIKAALDSKYIEHCYVSTDDLEIAKISESFGAKVILRPSELAQDDTTSSSALRHAIRLLEENNLNRDWYVHLQPTSPLRTWKEINQAIEIFVDAGCKKSVVSCCEVDHHPMKAFRLNEMNEPIIENHLNFECPRQKLPNYYRINGAIYIFQSEYLYMEDSLITKPFIPFIMSKSKSVDIDDIFDFMLAEYMMKEKENAKN